LTNPKKYIPGTKELQIFRIYWTLCQNNLLR
jgi:hypothetical protein